MNIMTSNSHRTTTLAISALLCFSGAHAQNIDVLFSGIRSAKGQIVVKVFTDDKGFEDNKPVKTIKCPKSGIVNGEMTAKLNLEPGIYGLALLDDEDSNNKMEYNFVGMPKEGFGFSNFYVSGLKKPKFEQFKFVLNKDQRMKVNMKIRYL